MLIQYCCHVYWPRSKLWGVMSVVAALWIFSSRSSVVHVQVWYTSDYMTQRKKSRGVRSRNLGGHSVGPLCPIYGPRRTTSNKFCTLQNDVMLHPAGSKSDIIVWITFHPRTFPTHHSTTGRISWCSLLLPGILAPKNVTMCHAPHGYSWVNLVISVNCNMRIILLPVHGVVSFTYQLRWKCTSAAHGIVYSDSFWLKPFTKLNSAICTIST
jgi:hypothetical protein